MSNPLFRQWVESLPDETWAKKDLSACRLGWKAAIESIVNTLNDESPIYKGTQKYLNISRISACIHAHTIEVNDAENSSS